MNIPKEHLKKYLDTEERYILNMHRTETDEVDKRMFEAKLELISQISDDLELGD